MGPPLQHCRRASRPPLILSAETEEPGWGVVSHREHAKRASDACYGVWGRSPQLHHNDVHRRGARLQRYVNAAGGPPVGRGAQLQEYRGENQQYRLDVRRCVDLNECLEGPCKNGKFQNN